jgi:hypothetical protein
MLYIHKARMLIVQYLPSVVPGYSATTYLDQGTSVQFLFILGPGSGRALGDIFFECILRD